MDTTTFFKFKTKTIIIISVVACIVPFILLTNIEFFELNQIKNKVNHFKYQHLKKPNEIVTRYNNETILNTKLYFGERSVTKKNQNYANKISNGIEQQKIGDTTSGSTSCTFIESCAIRCRTGNLQDVIERINNLIEKGNKCTSQYITLEIVSITFPSNTLSAGWLQDLNVGINILKIINSDLEELGDSAFSGKPFGSTGNPLSLTLTDINVKYLKKSSFSGSSISILEIKFGSMRQSITIEEDVLGDTSYSVQSIGINYCLDSSKTIKNLTGQGNILAGLKTLDLSYNMITTLEADIFSKAPNLEQLYLRSNGLTNIDVKAFTGLNRLSQLFLNINKLNTLPKGAFNDLDSILSLFLEDNPWNCNCDLQWLKEYLMTIRQIENKRCKMGSEWQDMEDVEFCPTNSSTMTPITKVTSKTSETTESSVTISSTTPKDTNDFIFEKILCRNLLSYQFDNITDDSEAKLLLTAIFKRRNINFTISEIGNSATYKLDIVGGIKLTDYLIWTSVENKSDYGCIYNIKSYVLINLQFEKTYTICFASNDTVDTYALIADDCTAIATPLDWNHRTWLYNNQKTTIVLSVTFTFLITLVAASGAVYYLVKYNPELIKGNKRVLIVKRGSYSPNVLVMPSKKNNIRHVSLCTNYEGYLTPKLKRWAKSKFSDLRYQGLDTISYKTISDSSSDKMIHSDGCFDDKTNEKNLYEPPPLPPNHPAKRRDSGRPYFYSNM